MFLILFFTAWLMCGLIAMDLEAWYFDEGYDVVYLLGGIVSLINILYYTKMGSENFEAWFERKHRKG